MIVMMQSALRNSAVPVADQRTCMAIRMSVPVGEGGVAYVMDSGTYNKLKS